MQRRRSDMRHLVYLIPIVMLVLLTVGQSTQAAECCEQYGTITVGDYIIQNNVWGATSRQCVQSIGETGFTVSVSEHNQGSVAAYPSIFRGCHWGTCTSGWTSQRISSISSANFSFSVSSARPAGNYNVTTEAWLSPNPDTSGGYRGGRKL